MLSDHVTLLNPSLYTFYRTGYGSPGGELYFGISVDHTTDTLTIDQTLIADGQKIRIIPTDDNPPPQGLGRYTDYYVVNSNRGRFQIALTQNGDPISFTSNANGQIYAAIQTQQYLWHDPNVVHWVTYARQNIAEARKFGDTEVIAWLSPSFQGVGQTYLDKNFIRLQLDTLYELADGINLYNPVPVPDDQPFWEALREFDAYLNSPTQFTVTVASSQRGAPDPSDAGRLEKMELLKSLARPQIGPLLASAGRGPTVVSELPSPLVLGSAFRTLWSVRDRPSDVSSAWHTRSGDAPESREVKTKAFVSSRYFTALQAFSSQAVDEVFSQGEQTFRTAPRPVY